MSDTAEVAGSSKFAKVSHECWMLLYAVWIFPEIESIVQAFKVPEEFPEVLRSLVREILRSQPQSADDINKFGK